MPVKATCHGCGRTVSASDSAAGHKAKCPDCGAVIALPQTPSSDLDEVAVAAAALARSSTPSASRASATTIDRLVAQTSPYGSVRLWAVIVLGVGIAAAVLCFVAGLVALVLLSMRGHPIEGVLSFVAGLVLAVALFLSGRVSNAMMRLAADVGDRTRQTAQAIEEFLNRQNGA